MSVEILIVEDEPKLANLLFDYCKQAGFCATIQVDGQSALDYFRTHQQTIKFIVLDLMLPSLDGISICQTIRQHSNVPILMASAKVEEIDRLIGLEMGADDYICKPYSPREVIARIKAILRRVDQLQQNGPLTACQLLADLQLDPHKQLAVLQGKKLVLTAVEFQILCTLANEPGRIFSRQHLIGCIYPDHRVVSDRTIDSHIKKLRQRIDEQCPNSALIHSVYGVGYKFENLNDTGQIS